MKEFVNKIVTLDNIKQWEERDSVIKESVSQHSFKVSAICVFLLESVTSTDYYQDKRYSEFKLKSLEYAILHDFDESVLSRDISHVVKYNNYNGDKVREVLDDYVNHSLKSMGLDKLFNRFKDEKVKLFIKLCDWIALYTFIIRNKDMGVNTFEKEMEYCLANIEEKITQVREMLDKEYGLQTLELGKVIQNLIN